MGQFVDLIPGGGGWQSLFAGQFAGQLFSFHALLGIPQSGPQGSELALLSF